MDDAPSPLQRALTWFEATPAEIAGLLVLLTGAVLTTVLLVWEANQRPEPPPVATGPGDVAGPADIGAHGAGGGLDGPADVEADHGHPGTGEDEVAGPVVVHVTGAVARPGVITLDDGGRVTDAIAAAGGATDDARLDLVNLARPLQDGEHVHLPREGEETRPPGVGSPGAAAGQGPADRIDLNTATADQLETLPGIGPAKASAILRHREQHGPFSVPGDLRDVSGIGEATFQRLADLVTVS